MIVKIAFVIYDLSKGGAERVVALLSKEISKNNDVKIIVFDSNIEYEYGGKIINLNVPSKKGLIKKAINILKRVIKLKKILRKEKFDKVFSFMESANIVSILTGEDIFISVRTNPNRFSNKKVLRFFYNLKNVKKIIVPAFGIKKILEDNNFKNIKVISNPIDFNTINVLKKEKIDINYKYILAIGRLEKVKNYNLLIKAFANSNIKNYTNLLILGEGKERKNLEKLIKNLKLDKKVILKGKEKNVYKYLYNAEMFILSSKYEGFPNTLIEALACEVPCISTDCPTGPNEIIKNGFNGILIKNENVEELTNAMDKLYFNEDLKNKFKKNAIKSVEHLDIRKIAKEWLNL